MRGFFQQHGGPEVLKEVYVPYLRSNIVRLELNFPAEADLRQAPSNTDSGVGGLEDEFPQQLHPCGKKIIQILGSA